MDMLEGIRSGIGILASQGVPLPVLGIVAMVALALLVWNRTRSAHSLMARLWQLFHGNKECKDSAIGKFLDEQSALMQFRFTTGVPVRTRKQAQSVIDWTRKHNEDIGAVAACGPYFDLEHVTLKEEKLLPKRWHLFARYGITFLLFLVFILFSLGSVWDSAILQMRRSGTFFTLSVEYAKPVLSGAGIAREQCLNGSLLPPNGFRSEDVKLICDIFKDKNLNSYLRQTIEQQKNTFGVGALVFAGYLWLTFGWLMQGISARSMLKRLRNKHDQPSLALTDDHSAGTQ